jgi:uncharacterized repeat protein (TIGR01451 family)
MNEKKKFSTEIQLMLVLFFAAITLVAVSMLLGGLSSRPAMAQGPIPISTPTVAFTPAPLAAFGLTADSIVGLAVPSYDLSIANTAQVISVTSGSIVTYTMTITNNSTSSAQYFYFYDSYPSEMVQPINYTFSAGVTALSNAAANPQWLITSVLSANSSMMITVTGQLTSTRDVQVVNTAVVTPFITGADPIPGNNTASASVTVDGYLDLLTLYLPIVSKYPTPTPTPTPPVVLAYHQNFEDKNSSDAWYQGSGYGNGCSTTYDGGRYRVDQTKENRTCLPVAKDKGKPESPFRTYGEWEVTAYHSEGESNAALGIFINGAGGDNYYAFRIWPNASCSSGSGGAWELQRRKDGNENTIAGSKTTCTSFIKRGYGIDNANTIRIAHNGLVLSMYSNGNLLGTHTENTSDNRTGTAAGVYVRSADKDVKIKFDDFKAYRYP